VCLTKHNLFFVGIGTDGYIFIKWYNITRPEHLNNINNKLLAVDSRSEVDNFKFPCIFQVINIKNKT
jgi:hypothetical protein